MTFTPSNQEEQLAYDLVTRIMLDAALEQSSDVHLEPLREQVVVRYRVDGGLREISRHPVGVARSACRVLKRMSCGDPDQTHLPQDGRLMLATDALGRLDVRVSTFPTVFGERVVMPLASPWGCGLWVSPEPRWPGWRPCCVSPTACSFSADPWAAARASRRVRPWAFWPSAARGAAAS